MQLSCILKSLMRTVLGAAALAFIPMAVWAQRDNPCPRFAAGSAITEPANLLSRNGVLQVAFTYQTRTDGALLVSSARTPYLGSGRAGRRFRSAYRGGY
jgi:hypothetical protein